MLSQGDEQAPTALLLHGLPGAAEDWNRLSDELAGSFHVVAIDRPGYGGSAEEALPVPAQVDLYAEVLAEVADGPALVAGHSYGAIPAAELASRFPAAVGALVLLAPAVGEHRGGRPVPPGLATAERMLRHPGLSGALAATVLSSAGRQMIARSAGPASFAPDPPDAEQIAVVAESMLRVRSLRSLLREAQLMTDEMDVVDRMLGTLRLPVAVIHARGDTVIPWKGGRSVANAIPGANFHAIDGGHMLTVSRAGEVAPLVLELACRAGILGATGDPESGPPCQAPGP